MLKINDTNPFLSNILYDFQDAIGYAIQTLTQFVAWTFLLINCSCVMIFLGGVCWLLIAFIEDIEMELSSLNDLNENRIKLKQKLYFIVKFHSKAMQLS